MNIKLTTILAAVAATFAINANAASVNLLANGSFEDGLNGWESIGVVQKQPMRTIQYNNAAAGAKGESVPLDSVATLSPDASGNMAVYFVDDGAIDAGLEQTIFLAAGTYRVGFDVYAPRNGFAQPFEALFKAEFAGLTLADFAVSTGPRATWTNFAGLATVAADGFYDVSFVFNSPGTGNAKDLVVDRAYVMLESLADNQVPEPASLALVGLGLTALGFKRRTSAKQPS